MNVPLAPELGLFLDKAFYDSYNTRWGEDRELLDLDDFQEQIDAFKVMSAQPLRHPAIGYTFTTFHYRHASLRI